MLHHTSRNDPPDRRRGRPETLSSEPPDRILVGGRIWTGVSPERRPIHGWAIAIGGARITAIGPADQLLATRRRRTIVTDVEGGLIVPGFVDAHVHLQTGGFDLSRVDLRSAASREDFLHRVAERVESTPAGEWVLGGGWNEHRWGGELPSREWLDRVAPEHPALLTRSDLHIGVANTEALRRAGLGTEAGVPRPCDGPIDVDPTTGAPTGILRERAIELVSSSVPSPTPPEREEALLAAARHALRHGVTQLHDMGVLQNSDESWASLDALRRLHDRGALPLRVSAAVPLDDRHRLVDWIVSGDGGDERLRWGSVKAFVDGSLGASTAWFLDDYSDAPGNRGGPVVDLNELREGIEEAVRLGLQPIMHAIGDAATAWLGGVYAELCRSYAGRDLRLRVEHAQHVNEDTVAALAHPGIICSVQPAHLLDDGPWAEARIGAARTDGAFPFASLLATGARPAFGSDWTVAPLDPRLALAAATGRLVATADGVKVWGPSERISIGSAMRAHTLDAARAAFFDAETGTIEPGKRADLVVLDHSPFDLPPEALMTDLQVRATFVDGNIAWQREERPIGTTNVTVETSVVEPG